MNEIAPSAIGDRNPGKLIVTICYGTCGSNTPATLLSENWSSIYADPSDGVTETGGTNGGTLYDGDLSTTYSLSCPISGGNPYISIDLASVVNI